MSKHRNFITVMDIQDLLGKDITEDAIQSMLNEVRKDDSKILDYNDVSSLSNH
jgi:Ca2+-binding EF-hand superfamily protein